MKLLNRVKNDKRLYFLSILIVGLLLVLVLRVAYAYMAAFVNEGLGNASLSSDTVDNFNFVAGNPLSLNATSSTLPEGGDNLMVTSKPKVTLRANSTNNTAENSYYVYLNIPTNTFTYTTDDNTPEIILTITKPDGTEVTSIDGLTYATTYGVSGFDVTAYSGLIKVYEGYTITSNSSTTDTTQEWTFTLTYLNLGVDQSANYGKSLSTEVKIQKEEYVPSLADVCSNGDNLAGCIKNFYTTDGENNLYYHDGIGTYLNANQEAGDNSYRYSGGDYEISDKYKNTYNEFDLLVPECDEGYSLNKIGCGDLWCVNQSTYEYVEPKYSLVYDSNKIIYSTKDEAFNKAIQDEYINATDVNNYVCFGSNANPCPYENLYRIIGVFGEQVKLIKYDAATAEMLGTTAMGMDSSNPSYYKGKLTNIPTFSWSGSLSTNNYWEQSTLNTQILNGTYLTNLGSWADKIAETTWIVGGNESVTIEESTAKSVYEYEILSPYENITYYGKVGLMYVNEYMYSFIPDSWLFIGMDDSDLGETCLYNALDYGWMKMGINEWTITRDSFYDLNSALYITSDGYIIANRTSEYSALRPTFYLKSSVTYVSGIGTRNDPFRIS